MADKTITLSKGQYLAQVYPLIESNIILNKKLSGVGATQCEIIAPRHSIIVVPNTPIITCKVNKHRFSNNLFGVMQAVSVLDIVDYLEQTTSKNLFIKIMVTPESFYKVRQAFDEVETDMYQSCFLMLDECHKFIKERDFRKDITLPMDSFFKFKGKALVSATPITPSDPRFNTNSFKTVEVIPDYNYRFNLTVIPTDDIRRAFLDDVRGAAEGKFVPQEPQCIFVNSATIIADLVNQSNLHKLSSIFCSETSATKLKQMGFINVHTEWSEEYEKPFMFFTSRFFTGLDIMLTREPRVLYFSDAQNAVHTLMDPETDMAQACGRFRNGIFEIIHYVVFDPSLESKTEEDIEEYIRGIMKAYDALQRVYQESESSIEREAIEASIQALPFNEIFTDGELDYFLKDNIIHNELLLFNYRDKNTLLDAYCNSKYFGMVMEEAPHLYHDRPKLLPALKKLSPAIIKQRQREAIIEALDAISPYRHTSEISDIIYTLRSYDSLIVDAYFRLGKEAIVQYDYNTKLIREALQNQRCSKMNPDQAFLHAIHSSFEVGHTYLRDFAKEELKRIYHKYEVTPPSAITAMSLRWHFEIDEKARIGSQKAVRIIAPKVQSVVNYFETIKPNTETKPSEELDG